MRKKGVVLAIVIGVLIVIFTLAVVAINLMTQQARVAEHKIRRMRAIYAARAGMVHGLELIRQGIFPGGGTEIISIGAGVNGYPTGGLEVVISYDDQDTSGPLNTSPVNITVGY